MKEMVIKDIAAFRAAQGFVGDDDDRPALKGVLIEPDGTVVATDGRIMFIGKEVVEACGLEKEVIIEPTKMLHKYSSIATIDIETQRITTDKGNVSFRIIKEPYVGYKRGVPSDPIIPIESIGLTLAVMTKVMGALASFQNRGQVIPMKFSFGGQYTGIRVSICNRDNIQIIIMPARV